MRILLRGWYGERNLGDDLLLLKMLEHIPRHHDLTIVGRESGLAEIVPSDRPFRTAPGYESDRRFVNHVVASDCLILGGGGLFPDKRNGLGKYLDIVLALLLRKKVVIMGVGINPHKEGLERLIWSWIARRATYLSVRGSQSAEFVQACAGPRVSVPMRHDLYLAGPIQGRPFEGLAGVGKPVALICPAGFFPDPGSGAAPEECARHLALAREIGAAARRLVEAGYEPVFVSFFPLADRAIIRDSADAAGLSTPRELEYGRDFSAAEVGSLFQQASFCLCMRFHSLLLAVQNRRNLVSITYDYKSRSLLETVGLESAEVEIGVGKSLCLGTDADLPPGRLAELVAEVLPRRDAVEAQLAARVPQLEAEAGLNFKALSEVLQGGGLALPGESRRHSTWATVRHLIGRARRGVTWADKVTAFLCGGLAAMGDHRAGLRKRFSHWLDGRARGGAVTLRLRIQGRVAELNMRAGNRADYLIGGEMVWGSYPPPGARPSLIVDGGANIGMFSVLAAAYCPGVPLVCYEPDADNLVWLERNLKANAIDAKIVPKALWSRDVTLYYHPAESYTGHVDETPSAFPIPCTTPEVVDHCWLKLDIEGAEYEVVPVVLAARETPLLISMEIHEANTRGAGLVEMMRRSGYEFRETPDLTASCINVEAHRMS